MCCVSVEPGAGEAMIDAEVALARRVDHFFRQSRWRIVAIPSSRAPLSFEIVAQWLLVETRLPMSRLVNVRGPETRAVRGEYLIHQYNLFGPGLARHSTEFKLRVGDDYFPLCSDRASCFVILACQPLKIGRTGTANHQAHPPHRDAFAVTFVRFGG